MTTLALRPDPVLRAPGRGLAGYLLLPRPKDLVKAVVAPLAFATGALTTGHLADGVLPRVALVWLVLELLVYQARYQWNDVRGFAADQAHPDAASRGRLPGPVERGPQHIGASLAVLALRLALTVLVALAVPEVRPTVLLLTVGVFGVAAVYERLRTAATGHSSQVPVPLRPALVALWVAVGAGYAVRGLVGLSLVLPLGHRPGLVVPAVLAMWSLGVVFVTCRWALEAMCFGTVVHGRVVWSCGAHQAREHTLGLVRWLPARVPGDVAETCSWRALQGRTPLTAPWHLALVVAAASAGLLGGQLAGAPLVPLALGGSMLAVVVAALPGHRLPAAVVGVLLLLTLLLLLGAPLLAALPVLVVLAAYGCFTRQCADEVGRPLRRLLPR